MSGAHQQQHRFADFHMSPFGQQQPSASFAMDQRTSASFEEPSFNDTTCSQYGSTANMDDSVTSVENGFDSYAFPPFEPSFGDHFADIHLNNSPISPLLMGALTGEQEDAFDPRGDMPFTTFNSDAHAAPWNPAIPRSDPSAMTASLQIPGQPKHQFMQSALSRSFDSGYVSRPQLETPSLASAPCELEPSQMDEISEVGTSEQPNRRRKPFVCREEGPHRTRHFSNINDLERHQRSTHGMKASHSRTAYYKCKVPQCKNPEKIWDRKDNFRSHLLRKHFGSKMDELTKVEIDQVVANSELQLSEEEMAELHRLKLAARIASRAAAQKRDQRRVSRQNSNATAERGRGRKRGASNVSAAASTTPSAIEGSESVFDHADNESFVFGEEMEGLALHPSISPTSVPQYEGMASLQVPVTRGWLAAVPPSATSSNMSYDHRSDLW